MSHQWIPHALIAQQDRAVSAMALLLMLAGLLVAFLLATIVVRLARRSTVGSRRRPPGEECERVDAWSEAGRRLQIPPEDEGDGDLSGPESLGDRSA